MGLFSPVQATTLQKAEMTCLLLLSLPPTCFPAYSCSNLLLLLLLPVVDCFFTCGGWGSDPTVKVVISMDSDSFREHSLVYVGVQSKPHSMMATDAPSPLPSLNNLYRCIYVCMCTFGRMCSYRNRRYSVSCLDIMAKPDQDACWESQQRSEQRNF